MKKLITSLSLICAGLVLVSLTFTGETDAGVADKAVGLWLFDDGGGDTAKDSSGNGNDGTLVGGPEWVDGKFGGALKFGGESLVDCGNDPSLDFVGSTNFSLSAWIKPLSAQADKVIVWKGLGCKTNCEYILGVGWHEDPGGDGVKGSCLSFHFLAQGKPVQHVVDEEDLPVGEWLHAAGTYDGSQMKLYRDGELVNTQDATGELWSCPDNTTIGADPGCGVRGVFDGIIDEVMIFDVTLTEDEVNELAKSGATGVVEPIGKLSTTWAGIKYQDSM